ncbi:hypothetical protein ERJ75_000646800 [Trypanosoma vivax]|nr:hypothetical protein ERJ75_000646800 [Trypanosoma vivax]
MGSWLFPPACSVRPAIAKARTSRVASARRHVARRCPSAKLAHAHHAIPVPPPFPPHKVRRTTGGNASRHGRATVSAFRACVASCAWPQDRCRAQCDAASRQSEPATRVAARTGRPQRSLLRAPACPAVFRDAVSVCVVRHASLCCESAAASILLAPPSGHLNPPLSLALPWANARATVPRQRRAALRSRHANDAVSSPARRCDRVGPRRHACACPSLRASSAAIVGWPAHRVAAGSADAREGGRQWSERRAKGEPTTQRLQRVPCTPARWTRHETKLRGRGRALAPATRSCVGARSLRAHRGQARPSTVWREGAQDAGLGVRKGAVAAGGKRRRTRSKRACPGSRTLASGAGATCSRWTNGRRGQAATQGPRRLARRGPVSPDCAFRRRPDRIAHEEKVAARGQAPYERCAATLHAAKGRRNRSSAGSGQFCRTAWVSVTRRTRAEGQWRVARNLRHPWPR